MKLALLWALAISALNKSEMSAQRMPLTLLAAIDDADARAAKQDAEFIAAFFKFIAGGKRHVRVINGDTALGSHIRDFKILLF